MSQQEFDNDVLRGIYEGMVAIEVDKTPELVRSALDSGQDVLKIVDALSAGIKVVGDKFEALECFLPELIMAARIMEKSMDILKPSLEKMDIKVGSTGTIVMANVQGDIHDIGRQIVVAMLRVAGFEVHDLGHDVKSDVIIDKAVELKADIIGLSSLLTTSLPYARQVLELLKARQLRERFKVAMGGGAVTPEYSEQIGADGYSRDAASAIGLMQKLAAGR